jgi:hypothetical protein
MKTLYVKSVTGDRGKLENLKDRKTMKERIEMVSMMACMLILFLFTAAPSFIPTIITNEPGNSCGYGKIYDCAW